MDLRSFTVKLASAVLVVVVLITARAPAIAAPSHKHALLIGISNYSQYNKDKLFGNLDCAEDVHRIKIALVHTFGYDPSPAHGQIAELTSPANTTRASIIAAFEKLARDTVDGDLAYIHYSGHGAQVQSD